MCIVYLLRRLERDSGGVVRARELPVHARQQGLRLGAGLQ